VICCHAEKLRTDKNRLFGGLRANFEATGIHHQKGDRQRRKSGRDKFACADENDNKRSVDRATMGQQGGERRRRVARGGGERESAPVVWTGYSRR